MILGAVAGERGDHPEAAVLVPPRATAVPSEMAETEPTQCDHPLPRPAPPLARYPPRR